MKKLMILLLFVLPLSYTLSLIGAQNDISICRVVKNSGIYIFCDSDPITQYDYLGNLKGKHTLMPQYSTLRDDFVKKCAKKYKDAKGIILHLVSGGKDTAEAIKF